MSSSSSLTTRSIYQPQLRGSHLYSCSISKQHVLAKYWLESILEQQLPLNDLYLCLRDGYYLCKIIHLIQQQQEIFYDLPQDRIQYFLKSVKDFGLQSSDLFNINDLINGENMTKVVSTILILSHCYSVKRFSIKKSLPKRSQSYSFQFQEKVVNITRSKSETLFLNNKMNNNKQQQQQQQQGLLTKENKEITLDWDDYSINDEEELQSLCNDEDEIYNTKKSKTPSSSGDSGYGTTTKKKYQKQQNKAQDLFEALFEPPPPPTTTTTTTSKRLSSLFSNNKDEPHYVKFQTWSTSNNRANEEYLYKSSPLPLPPPPPPLPPMIKIEKQHLPSPSQQQQTLKKQQEQQRTRRRTDPSLVHGISLDNDLLHHFDQDKNLIARYKLGNIIGKGHFGTVYRALDLISGKTFAIKQIDLYDSRKSDIEDMMKEATLLSSLAHTNIVKYQGFIQTQQHMNIVLEFVENGSLRNTLKSFGNALPEHLVASYCHDILQGLSYLHARDVVHCDLKAANILTTKSGNVKLSDFGVSLNLKLRNHKDNIVSGTPFWMSPEVIELKGASVQSDIWSLGCTIIELCTGKPPYADLITMTAMFKIVEDDCPPLPNNISNHLLDFLKLCFKKNPLERPTAKQLLNHSWIVASTATATTSTPPKSNSTILNNYLQKTAKKDDTIIPKTSNSMKLMRSTPSLLLPYPPPPPPPLPSHQSTFQSKSLFVNKLNQRQHSLARQSMPALVVKNQTFKPQHVHNLIECSFPKEVGQCKVCHHSIKHDALVCKDFCGYICHQQCNNQKTSDQKTGPKPMSSVSTQLREKFSFSKILSKSQQQELDRILEHPKSKSSSWWKKK